MAIKPNEPITLVKGADIGEIPPTPLTPPPNEASVMQAAELLLKFGHLYGKPIAYKQEQNGRLIQHILPNPKTEFSQISSSSKTTLKMHTETAFHPHKPDVLILMCLRGDDLAPTTYAVFEDILEQMDIDLMYELMRPQFYVQPDLSFRTDGRECKEWLIPIIDCRHKKLRFSFDEDLMRAKTETAQHALSRLKELVASNIKEVVLESGDVLIIDNHSVVHGRKPFQPRYDGTDRWLMRLMVRNSLPAEGEYSLLPHPVIMTEFASA
jgi:L-asparagine oxygenase